MPAPKQLKKYEFRASGDESNLHRLAFRIPESLKNRIDEFTKENGVSARNDRIREILKEYF